MSHPHTPAPWRWKKGTPTLLVGGQRSTIILDDACCNPQDEALIAAAPELLEALRDMTAFVGGMSFVPQETVAECDRLTEKALDAIQKAEGRS